MDDYFFKKAAIPAVLFSLVLGPTLLFGEVDQKQNNLSFHEAKKLAYDRNPAVRASRQKWEATRQKAPQARSFPDPMLGFVTMAEPLQTRAGPMEEKYSISQRFPFFGKRGLKGDMAEQEALVAEQAYRSKSLEIQAKVAQAYFDLYYVDQAIRVNDELADQIRHFARVAERKYTVGGQSQASVFRAQVELAKVLNDVITLKQERVSALAKLNAILDRPPRTPASPAPPSDFPPIPAADRLQSVAQKNRPEILAAQAMIERSEAARSLALREYFPDLSVGYEQSVIGAGTTNTPFDGKDAKAFLFQVNLPIWAGRQNAARQEAKSQEEASESLYKDWVNQTMFEVEDKAVKAETSQRLIKLYQDTVLPQADEALKSSQNGYEADRVPFLDLLDSVRSLLKFEQEYYRYNADFAQRLADLERVLGVPFEQVGGENEK